MKTMQENLVETDERDRYFVQINLKILNVNAQAILRSIINSRKIHSMAILVNSKKK